MLRELNIRVTFYATFTNILIYVMFQSFWRFKIFFQRCSSMDGTTRTRTMQYVDMWTDSGPSISKSEHSGSFATRISFVEMQDRNDRRLMVVCVNQQPNSLSCRTSCCILRFSTYWNAMAYIFRNFFIGLELALFPYFISYKRHLLVFYIRMIVYTSLRLLFTSFWTYAQRQRSQNRTDTFQS